MLKRIGFLTGVVMASIALFGTMASSASAKEQKGFFLAGEKSEEKAKQPRFEGESYPTYLWGDQDTTHEWGFKGRTLKCPAVEFFGKLSASASELALTKFYYYGLCTFSTGGNLTILANGCEDTITVLNSGPPYVGQYGIKCPAGKSYELTEHYTGGSCTFAFPPQTSMGTVSLENKGEAKKRGVQVKLNLTDLKYTQSGTGFICVISAGTYENGTYSGTMTLEGFDKP